MHYAKTYFSFHNILFFNFHTCIVMIPMIWNLFIFIMSCAQYNIEWVRRNDTKKITLCISNIIINFPFVISRSIVVTYSSEKEFNRVIEYALCAVTSQRNEWQKAIASASRRIETHLDERFRAFPIECLNTETAVGLWLHVQSLAGEELPRTPSPYSSSVIV